MTPQAITLEREIDFKDCVVLIFNAPEQTPERYVQTIFKQDSAQSTFYPPIHDRDFKTAAIYAGYSNALQHGIEHDILHAYLAELQGRVSYSVWSNAHGTHKEGQPWSQRVKDEEHLVVSMQRYINTGALDEYGKLTEAFEERLNGVALAALLLLRPWLKPLC